MRRKVVITGAGGLLGRALAECGASRWDVHALTHADLDICDPAAVNEALERLRPQVVINCAALSNVDQCQREPDRAFAVNAHGPGHLARACGRIGADLVQISTDYVFDGRKGAPYTLTDVPHPINLYGESKLAGEQAVRRALDRFYIVRPARIFGRGGRNFATKILDLIAARQPIRAIVDEVGSPTYARDLAERIIRIVEEGPPGIYHVTNGGACSWYEFACEVVRLLGRQDIPIEPVRSDDLGRPAPRPAATALRCLLSEDLGWSPLRPWPEAYVDFLKEVGIR
ncbi:MAG TPA: dTDP-4-dehydrorhamnose reductase [Blastocatellia bacterium]|nr:dTDP-4-dehydrorhamnose reductase [Blastocatellia bacterium]